jgi:hypothetical protein
MPTIIEPPDTHYYVAPYSLLSFLFGLYCDHEWSEEEYVRWEASESPRHSGTYTYSGYLNPYEPIPPAAREIINEQVKLNPTGSNGRRNPTTQQFEAFWPDFRAELLKPPTGESPKPGFRRAYFDPSRPILSALACIYLADATSVPQIVGMAGKLPAVFSDLIAMRSAGAGFEGLLDNPLKQLLLEDFQAPEEAW